MGSLMRRILLLMATMSFAGVVIGGVAYALTMQCDGEGDQDPRAEQCQGTEENDQITGSEQRDVIHALGGRDLVSARGGEDDVDGGVGADDISGGVGGDFVLGGGGPDNIKGGPSTPDASEPANAFVCAPGDVSIVGTQQLYGENGNDILSGGPDNDFLVGGAGRNDLSGNGGDDCLALFGAPNERVSGGDGDDIIGAADGNGDDVFCGTGLDTVLADAEDRVAANCEDVIEPPSALQSEGATPVVEVSITTPEGTTTMKP